jgi:hypothetical protein
MKSTLPPRPESFPRRSQTWRLRVLHAAVQLLAVAAMVAIYVVLVTRGRVFSSGPW